jgi:hypothetical protein
VCSLCVREVASANLCFRLMCEVVGRSSGGRERSGGRREVASTADW